MTTRREFITLLGNAAVAWPLSARAQQADRVRRIGILMGLFENHPEAQPRITAFRKELQKLGWTERHNIRIDIRWGAGDTSRLRAFARELVELHPDVIVAHASPSTAALMQESSVIPIVFVQVADPVGSGFIQSFARPSGNVTGFTNHEYSSIGGKWLELLKQIAPNSTRVALVFNPETMPYVLFLRPLEAVALSFAVELIPTPVRSATEVEHAISAFARQPNGGVLVFPDIFTGTHSALIVGQAARNRLPAVYPFRFFTEDGGLISYGSEPIDLYRRAASYVDRIFRGEKPSELPVQAPTKYELVINLKTAKALGLEVPPTLLALADEVIE